MLVSSLHITPPKSAHSRRFTVPSGNRIQNSQLICNYSEYQITINEFIRVRLRIKNHHILHIILDQNHHILYTTPPKSPHSLHHSSSKVTTLSTSLLQNHHILYITPPKSPHSLHHSSKITTFSASLPKN